MSGTFCRPSGSGAGIPGCARASSVSRNRVPATTPAAPAANAARVSSAAAMPPARSTGRPRATSSARGKNVSAGVSPAMCPPASQPWAISPSAPQTNARRACSSVPTMTNTNTPCPESHRSRARSMPKAMTATSIRDWTHASTWLRRTNGITRLTATQRSGAAARTWRTASRTSAGGSSPSVPRPPDPPVHRPFRPGRPEHQGGADLAGPRAHANRTAVWSMRRAWREFRPPRRLPAPAWR